MAEAFLYGQSGASSKRKPESYVYMAAYTVNTTWTVADAGWYRIFCFGKSGNGGAGGNGAVGDYNRETWGGNGGGGAGGNCGAVAVSDLYFERGDIVTLTINDTLTSFGSYMSAQAGANGGDGGRGSTGDYWATYAGLAGLPNTGIARAYEGNVVNADGFKGGRGGGRVGSEAVQAERGGNNGGLIEPKKTTPTTGGGGDGAGGARYYYDGVTSKYVVPDSYFTGTNASHGAAGTGNFRYPPTGVGDYRSGLWNGGDGGSYYSWGSPNVRLSGGGGGGGGGEGRYGPSAISSLRWAGAGGTAGLGQPGVIIIERGE